MRRAARFCKPAEAALGIRSLKEPSRAAAMESTPPAQSVTDAKAASTEAAPPAAPADAKPPAPTLDVSDAPQPTEAKPPALEISPRAWAERERDKEHDLTKCRAKSPRKRCSRACGGAGPENEDRKRADRRGRRRAVHHAGGAPSHAPARPSGWTRRQPRLARLLAEFGDKILPEASPSRRSS